MKWDDTISLSKWFDSALILSSIFSVINTLCVNNWPKRLFLNW